MRDMNGERKKEEASVLIIVEAWERSKSNSAVHIVVRILVRIVVLTLCAKTSNPLLATSPTRSKFPLKSGVKHSTKMWGDLSFRSLTVLAKWLAP